jgi:hypothetical protein
MVMVKKVLLIIFIFYFLVLIETSFLIHFNFSKIIPNLVFVFIIIMNFFNFPLWQKIFFAIIGGLYLDIFSLSAPFNFFGFYTVALVMGCFVLGLFLKKYVRIPIFQEK